MKLNIIIVPSSKKQIVKIIRKSRYVIIILSPYFLDSRVKDQISSEKVRKTLPLRLEHFSDITSIKIVTILIEYNTLDHQINLKEEKMPLFNVIYPLTEKELEILREYIEHATI